MSTGEGFEAVLEYVRIWLCTDGGGDEHPLRLIKLSQRADGGRSDTREIWLTSRQQIRSRLSKKILHALRDEECRRKGKREAHPASVPFPELPPPNKRFWCPTFSRGSGDPDETHDENNGGRRDERYNDEEPCWYHLAGLVRVRYVEIDRREGSFEWFDIFPTTGNGCDGDDDNPVEDVGCDELHRRHADSFDGPHVCESVCLMTTVRGRMQVKSRAGRQTSQNAQWDKRIKGS
jgi:hypothetical protein